MTRRNARARMRLSDIPKIGMKRRLRSDMARVRPPRARPARPGSRSSRRTPETITISAARAKAAMAGP